MRKGGSEPPLQALPYKLPGSLNANRWLSQWLRFHRDGRVTALSGKVEIGQGILTALRQMVADELDVALPRVTIRPASTDDSPNEGVTSGSRSISESGLALRHACAAAKGIFLSVAAQRTGIPVESLRVVDGDFVGPAATIGSYWADADIGLLDCEAPEHVRIKAAPDRTLSGSAVARIDLPDKVYGVPRFIHDLRLPGMRFARVVRPAAREARIVDVPDLTGVQVVRDGNFLAVVCASEIEANATAEKLRAQTRWEERDSLPEEASLRDHLMTARAETTTSASRPATSDARRTVSFDVFRPYLSHASIGLCCAVALWRDGALEVWSHSQSIFLLRKDIARALRIDESGVVVHHGEGAGCYGHNAADDVALDACLVARAVPGVPIRVQWTREDELGLAPLSPAMAVTITAGLDEGGNIVDWRHDIYGNGHLLRPGNFPVPSLLGASQISDPFPAPVSLNPVLAVGGGADRNAVPLYRTGGLQVDVHRLLDMPLRTSSLRGLGALANVWAIESMMEELASATGRDPVQYRLDHLDDPRGRDVIAAVLAMAGARIQDREGYGRGFGFAKYKGLGAYCAVVADIDAGEQIRVRQLWIAVDAGEIVNPEGAAHQVEGGAVQACSFALKEAVRFDRRAVTSNRWEDYAILRFSDVPEVETRLLERPDEPPAGVGECSLGPTIAAVANAIFDALGVRPRTMPFTADNLSADMG